MPVDGATVVDRPLLGENEPVRGIYLHIPFCARKCSYCDFYSVAASSPAMTEFRGLLTREMDMVRNRFPEDAAATADTVYFGGGTPTVFPPEALCGLLSAIRERFPVEPDAEITVEANPGTVTAEGLRAMREWGFTRVSIGVQSFTPATLRTLGRIHGVEEVRRTYRDARTAGFPSLGIDLIFGIPGQRTEDWEADLDRTITFLPARLAPRPRPGAGPPAPRGDRTGGACHAPRRGGGADVRNSADGPVGRGLPAVRDLELRPPRIRIPAQPEILAQGRNLWPGSLRARPALPPGNGFLRIADGEHALPRGIREGDPGGPSPLCGGSGVRFRRRLEGIPHLRAAHDRRSGPGGDRKKDRRPAGPPAGRRCRPDPDRQASPGRHPPPGAGQPVLRVERDPGSALVRSPGRMPADPLAGSLSSVAPAVTLAVSLAVSLAVPLTILLPFLPFAPPCLPVPVPEFVMLLQLAVRDAVLVSVDLPIVPGNPDDLHRYGPGTDDHPGAVVRPGPEPPLLLRRPPVPCVEEEIHPHTGGEIDHGPGDHDHLRRSCDHHGGRADVDADVHLGKGGARREDREQQCKCHANDPSCHLPLAHPHLLADLTATCW